jgi:hypothetical protein
MSEQRISAWEVLGSSGVTDGARQYHVGTSRCHLIYFYAGSVQRQSEKCTNWGVSTWGWARQGADQGEFFWEKYIFFGWMNGGRNENKAERRGGNDIRGVVGIMMSRRSDMIVIRNDCCWGLCNLVLRGMHRCTGGRECIVMFMSKCQLAERRMGEYRGKIKYVRGTSVDERKRRKGKNTKMDKKTTNNNNNNNILKEALFAYLVHKIFF